MNKNKIFRYTLKNDKEIRGYQDLENEMVVIIEENGNEVLRNLPIQNIDGDLCFEINGEIVYFSDVWYKVENVIKVVGN